MINSRRSFPSSDEIHSLRGRGVLYIVSGQHYVKAAIQSAKSVRKHSPHLGVHIYVDKESLQLLNDNDDSISSFGLIHSPHYRSKVDYLTKTPFERTLYLDSDTRICTPIDDLFDLLDRFDIALAHAHYRYHPKTMTMWKMDIPQCFPQFNGGVIVYRSTTEVFEFLESWRRAFHETSFEKDQVTLRELLWFGNLRIATLPPEYNLRSHKYLKIWDRFEAQPKILHFREFHEVETLHTTGLFGSLLQHLRSLMPLRLPRK